MSEIWWQQIEAGRTEVAVAATLARMCDVVGLTPAQLQRIGQEHLADLLQERHVMLAHGPPADAMETHLLQTPDLTEEQRQAVLAVAKALRSK